MRKKTGKNLAIILSGASGRMGQAIQGLSTEFNAGIIHRIDAKRDWKKAPAPRADVVVDFTTPKGLLAAIEWCISNRKPLVSGTTGLSSDERRTLKRASHKIPVLYSANMSLGIAVLSNMLQDLASLKTWDFQIEEAHHKKKVDRPSGTALLLQEKLVRATGRRQPPPNVIRGGGIAGIHQVWAMGPYEALVLQHTAFDRKVFAQGALYAASWLFDKKQPGLYDLTDLYPKN